MYVTADTCSDNRERLFSPTNKNLGLTLVLCDAAETNRTRPNHLVRFISSLGSPPDRFGFGFSKIGLKPNRSNHGPPHIYIHIFSSLDLAPELAVHWGHKIKFSSSLSSRQVLPGDQVLATALSFISFNAS